jgi:hypothetical protein
VKELAREAIAAARRQAEATYREIESQASDLMDAKAYAEARQALQPVVSRFGIPALAEQAKALLGEIADHERHAARVAQWGVVKAKSDQLLEAGKPDEAEQALAEAAGLDLPNLPALLARQRERIAAARRAADDRAVAAYAKEADQVWALFKERKYADADKLLAALAARPECRPAAALQQADATAAKLLKEFWSLVEGKLAARTGKFVAFDGVAGNVVSVKDGVVTVQAGAKADQRHVHRLTTKQALVHAEVGDDAHAKLLAGLFCLAQGEELDTAEQALAGAEPAPAVALFRQRLAALKTGAPKPPPGKTETPAPKATPLAEEDDEDLRPAPGKADAGWVRLFNGKDLTGWSTRGSGWAVEQGTLAWRPGCGYLWTEKAVGDFVLELQFKLARNSNSGVFFRTGDRASPVATGLELQLIDSFGKATPDARDCGSLYSCLAPRENAVKAPGLWNDLTLACRGSRVLVRLNGKTIGDTDLDRWTVAGRNPDGTTNPVRVALRDLPREGYIGLQDYGAPVWFRNIRLKHLPARR